MNQNNSDTYNQEYMKKLMLLSVLICGSIYSMRNPSEQAAAPATGKSVNGPDKPAWQCPDCNATELSHDIPMSCQKCGKVFEFIDIKGRTEDGREGILRFWFGKKT
jgi:rubredoxin